MPKRKRLSLNAFKTLCAKVHHDAPVDEDDGTKVSPEPDDRATEPKVVASPISHSMFHPLYRNLPIPTCLIGRPEDKVASTFTVPLTKSAQLPDVKESVADHFYEEQYTTSISAIWKNMGTVHIPVTINNRTEQYLIRRGYRHIYRSNRRRTLEEHKQRMTFLQGGECGYEGTARFPFSEWPNIFLQRAIDIQLGNISFQNDIVYPDTEGVSAFFDFDYRTKCTPYPLDVLIRHAMVCHDIMREYYVANTDVNLRMWVSLCEPKPKRSNDSKVHRYVIASGLHVVFPYVVVDCNRGHQLCESIQHRLRAKYGVVGILDDLYRPMTSLRPMGSLKIEKCFDCDESTRDTCISCHGKGKVKLNSSYKPFLLVDSLGNHRGEEMAKLVRDELPLVLFETSIVPPNDLLMLTDGYNVPPSAPRWTPSTSEYVPQKQSELPIHTNDNSGTLQSICHAIRTFRDPVYRHLYITKIIRRGNRYFISVRGPNNTLCYIRSPDGHTHQSNTIFFTLHRSSASKCITLTQMCYDKDCKKLLREMDPKRRKTLAIQLDGRILSKLFA